MSNTIANIKKYAYKEPYQYPSLEDVHPNIPYALTISPKYQSESLLETFMECYENCVTKLKVEFYLYPEISTKSTNLHYHGTVSFGSYLEIATFYWFTIRQLKQYCTFVLKPIEDKEKWLKYQIKQQPHLAALMLDNHLPNQITNKTNPYKLKKLPRKSVTNSLDHM